MTAPAATQPRFEATDIRPRHIGWSMLALLGLLFGSLGAVALILVWVGTANPHDAPSELSAAGTFAPGPRLQVSPQTERIAIEARARRLLEGAPRETANGVRRRIPIDEAMAQRVARGWADETEADR